MAERVDYELTEPEGELLAAVTADAAAAAGALGGSLGGALGGGPAGRLGGKRGGAAGGRLGAKATKPRTAEAAAEVEVPAAHARDRAIAAIEAAGTPIDDPNGRGDGSIWGVVGSGAMNMSPALVRVAIEQRSEWRSAVRVRATGREALIPQKIGAKAADRILEAIRSGA